MNLARNINMNQYFNIIKKKKKKTIRDTKSSQNFNFVSTIIVRVEDFPLISKKKVTPITIELKAHFNS